MERWGRKMGLKKGCGQREKTTKRERERLEKEGKREREEKKERKRELKVENRVTHIRRKKRLI